MLLSFNHDLPTGSFLAVTSTGLFLRHSSGMSASDMSSGNKLVIYSAQSSFVNASRVRLFVHEKGIAAQVEQVELDMLAGEHKRWPHLKRNPWGEVPVLVLPDGSHLSEAAAIVHYLDHRWAGTRRITGDTLEQQVQDIQWEERIRLRILVPILAMAHVQLGMLGHKLELTHNAAWGEHSRKEAIASAAVIDALLSDGREWLLGGPEPTFADITLGTTITVGNYPVIGVALNERYEHIDTYWRRWMQRPSFQQTYKDGTHGVPQISQYKASS